MCKVWLYLSPPKNKQKQTKNNNNKEKPTTKTPKPTTTLNDLNYDPASFSYRISLFPWLWSLKFVEIFCHTFPTQVHILWKQALCLCPLNAVEFNPTLTLKCVSHLLVQLMFYCLYTQSGPCSWTVGIFRVFRIIYPQLFSSWITMSSFCPSRFLRSAVVPLGVCSFPFSSSWLGRARYLYHPHISLIN